jgi:putative restriction endonuclease
MAKDHSCWLHKLATLRIDRASGNPAPHKPLLLLAILDMAGRGEIKSPELLLSPDLAFRFSVFWSVVSDRRTQPPDIRMPFHHLKTSGIWEPLMADGNPSPDKNLQPGYASTPRISTAWPIPSFAKTPSESSYTQNHTSCPRNASPCAAW